VEILDGRLKEAIDHIYLGAIKRFSGIKPVKTRSAILKLGREYGISDGKIKETFDRAISELAQKASTRRGIDEKSAAAAETRENEAASGRAEEADGREEELGDEIQFTPAWYSSSAKTGEINLETLYNNDGEIDYEQVRNIASRIISGESKIFRLNEREEQGRIRGGRRNVEASIISGADAGTHSTTSSRSRTKRIEANKKVESRLEKYAKNENIWFDYDEFTKRHTYLDKVEEAHIYKDRTGNFVLKAVDYNYFSPTYSPLEFIDERISLFNHLFPETAYELVGFTRDADGKFRFILKQPFIVFHKKPSSRKVSNVIKRLLGDGSELTSEQFANSDYHVSDLHPGNVIEDESGNVFVIDALTELTPERLGGKRKYEDFKIVESGKTKPQPLFNKDFQQQGERLEKRIARFMRGSLETALEKANITSNEKDGTLDFNAAGGAFLSKVFAAAGYKSATFAGAYLNPTQAVRVRTALANEKSAKGDKRSRSGHFAGRRRRAGGG
jgi:hypothetical protein